MATSALSARLERSGLVRVVASPWVGALVLFAAIAAVTRPATFNAPLEYDPPLYLYGGNLILHGHTPYVDMVATKGPATYLLFALIRLAAGTSVVVVHLTLVLFAALAAAALAAYVATFVGRAVGFLAGLVFALFSATADLEGYSSNTEQYGVAPMVGAWWLATRREWWATGLAGGLTAFASLMNPAFVVVAPFVGYELWASSSAGRGRRFAWAVAGVAVVAVPILLWIALSGAFGDMLDQVFGYARSGVGGGEGRPLLARPGTRAVGARSDRLRCRHARRAAAPRRDPRPALDRRRLGPRQGRQLLVLASLLPRAARHRGRHRGRDRLALAPVAAGARRHLRAGARGSSVERGPAVPGTRPSRAGDAPLLQEPVAPVPPRLPVSAFTGPTRLRATPSTWREASRADEATGAPGVYWLADRFSANDASSTPRPSAGLLAGYAAERRRELMTHPPGGDRADAAVPGRPRPPRRPPEVPLPASRTTIGGARVLAPRRGA